MKKLIVSFVAIGLAVLPAVAQSGGSLPSGWKGRLDNGDKSMAGAKVMLMGQGVHFTTGPAGVYYRTADKPMTAPYEARATFTQLQPAAHPEAYGLIVGGSDLEGAGQKYTYFLIRQDGKFLIKRRAGSETPTVVNWTDHASIKKADASGKSTNTLAVKADTDKVRFLINGTEVHAADAAQVDASGIAGLRINHNLNVMVDGFAVK